jgi:hypothetical protein
MGGSIVPSDMNLPVSTPELTHEFPKSLFVVPPSGGFVHGFVHGSKTGNGSEPIKRQRWK